MNNSWTHPDDEPIEDVEAYIRENGGDPDAIRARGIAHASRLIQARRAGKQVMEPEGSDDKNKFSKKIH